MSSSVRRIASVPTPATSRSRVAPWSGSRSCSGPIGPTGEAAHHDDDGARHGRQRDQRRGRQLHGDDLARGHAERAQPPVVGPPSLPDALQDLRPGQRGDDEQEHAERDQHDDERPERLVDRLLLLAPGRLQLVAELADGRRELDAGVGALGEVDVADRVDGEVPMLLVEGPAEHDRAGHRRLVGDGLDGDGADADDRHGLLGGGAGEGVLDAEVEPITDRQATALRRRGW